MTVVVSRNIRPLCSYYNNLVRSEPAQKTIKGTMAAKHVEETAKENCTGFGMFKVKLANILTKEIILNVAVVLEYPSSEIDLLQTKDSRYHLMVQYLDQRKDISESGIEPLLRALKELNLHGIHDKAKALFELHTEKRCTGDDQSMQQLKDQTGNLDLGSKGSLTSDTEGQNSLRLLCSSTVFLRETDSKQFQMSTIRLLEIASSHNVPISLVKLVGCSPRVDESGLNLILQSGLSLSILSSLQKLEIYDRDRRLTNEELAAILSYSSQCTSLKELRFYSYHVPDTIPVEIIPPSLKSRNVKVWNDSIFNRRLDLQTDRWQVCDKWGKLPGEEGFDGKSYRKSLLMFNIKQ